VRGMEAQAVECRRSMEIVERTAATRAGAVYEVLSRRRDPQIRRRIDLSPPRNALSKKSACGLMVD